MQPRKFADLRAKAAAKKDTVHSLAALAMKSIGATPHGDALRDYLASVIFDTTEPSGEGAWRETQGRRKFAENLLTMMDGGTNERDKDGSGGKRRSKAG